VVAFESQMSFDIQRTGGLKSMIFGGEGMFLSTITGTGRVWLQSMPINKLIHALAPHGSNSHKESGGILGNFLDAD
jgi:uncharacterized protein (AIM24 family)